MPDRESLHETAALRCVVALLTVGLLAGCAASPRSDELFEASRCAEIEAFAEQLVDIGIAYDYEPSGGPADLAQQVDAVLRGSLTGALAPGLTSGIPHLSYELADVEILAGEVPDDTKGASGAVMVSVASNPAVRSDDEHQQAIPRGAPVIAFVIHVPASDSLTAEGLIATMPEGFLPACEAGRPIGWVGEHGEWADMGTLDEVADAVGAIDPAS